MKDQSVAISNLTDEVKRLTRHVDTLQTSVDLLYKDRAILEELIASVGHLKEISIQTRVHQDNANQDLKATVKQTSEEVQDKIEDKTVILKTKDKNIVEKFIEKVGGD